MTKVESFIVGVIAILLATVVGYPLFKTITASGKVDYCYTESFTYHTPSQADTVIYQMHGFRNWRSDRIIGQNFKSLDEVKKAAADYGCELK